MKTFLAILILLATNVSLAADVLVVRPEGSDFQSLGEMIEKKLNSEYTLDTAVISKSISYEEFQDKITKSAAKVVVVMDNQAMRYLKKYFETNPKSKIRGIAAMGVNLKDLIQKNKYVAGVSYEVAGYLAVKSFKEATNGKAKTLLGFYRSSVSKVFAEEAKAQLSREKIVLKMVDIENVSDDDLGDFIKKQIKNTSPDAIWLVNDNKIINSKSISTLWLEVARQQKIPVICGIQKLAKELGICVYSETPTLAGTAEKIAGIIFGYIADENDADFYGVEYIQETEKTSNGFLMENLGIDASRQHDGIEIYTGEIKGR